MGICCLAPVLVPWFFGQSFHGAILPLRIMGFLNIAIGFSNILGTQILVGMGLDKLFLRCILYGTFSNFILNFIFIPLYGAVGASVASVIAEFLVTFSMLYYMLKKTPIRITVKSDIIKSLIGSLFFLFLLFFLPPLDNGIVYLIVYFTIAFVLYCLVQTLSKNSMMLSLIAVAKEKIKVLKGRR